jgi:hypothetical protein
VQCDFPSRLQSASSLPASSSANVERTERSMVLTTFRDGQALLGMNISHSGGGWVVCVGRDTLRVEKDVVD